MSDSPPMLILYTTEDGKSQIQLRAKDHTVWLSQREMAQLFKLPYILGLLTATSRGLTKDRLRLYFDDFAKMRLCVPVFAEQHRIATCLSSLDDLIAAQSERVSALRTHKQGLLQQLFPSTAEVSA